jgi:hypothetical protein
VNHNKQRDVFEQWRDSALYRALLLECEKRQEERERLRFEQRRRTGLAGAKAMTERRQREIAADWAKVTDAVVNRCLIARVTQSRQLHRTAPLLTAKVRYPCEANAPCPPILVGNPVPRAPSNLLSH